MHRIALWLRPIKSFLGLWKRENLRNRQHSVHMQRMQSQGEYNVMYSVSTTHDHFGHNGGILNEIRLVRNRLVGKM